MYRLASGLRCSPSFLFIVVAVLTSGCASTTPHDSKSYLRVISLSPEAGSSLDEHSILQADIEYEIVGFDKSQAYGIAPVFESTRGSGYTFNSLNRMTEAHLVEEDSGQSTLRYPVSRELLSEQLARPVKIWFYLVEQDQTGRSRVIGRSGPYTFSIE